MNYLGNLALTLTAVAAVFSVTTGTANIIAFLHSKKVKKWKIFRMTLVCTLVIFIVLASVLGYILYTNAQADVASAQANTWKTRVNEFEPFCQKSRSATWIVPKDAKLSTDIQCLDQGLSMTRSSTTTPAEIDLDRVDGQTYSQTKLDAEIQVTFFKEKDSNTMAGLVVQTPQQGSGGYGLAINSTGYWELGDNNGNRKAGHGILTGATIFRIRIRVEQNHLQAWINDELVVTSIDDTLNPSVGAVGLVVYGDHNPLSPVTFSNFTLKL